MAGAGVALDKAPGFNGAYADYSLAIEKHGKHLPSLVRRGLILRDRGRFDEAIADFNAALALDANFTAALVDRGVAHEMKGDYRAAIADYRTVIKNCPDALFAPQTRSAHLYSGRTLPASVVRLLEPRRSAYFNLVTLLSTCADDSVRDGAEAVRLAEVIRKLDQGRYYLFVAAEAAANAESGDLTKATALQREAVSVAQPDEKDRMQAFVEIYGQGRPQRTILSP